MYYANGQRTQLPNLCIDDRGSRRQAQHSVANGWEASCKVAPVAREVLDVIAGLVKLTPQPIEFDL
jgi:hypothetical protein